MRDSHHVVLIDRLRSLPAETEWLEFKRGRCSPAQLGEYLSALANSACLTRQRLGYLVFGIDDETHRVVGTEFDPYRTKVKGNQDLLPWLATGLNPNVGFDQHVVEHPDGRVVLFQIAAATDQPVGFYGRECIRIGSSNTDLRRHPAKERAIWARGDKWTEEICEQATVADLDPNAIAKARQNFSAKHPQREDEIREWTDVTLLNKAKVLKHGAVTNTALILLGKPDESYMLLRPKLARIRWSYRGGTSDVPRYEDIEPPLLFSADRSMALIRNLRVRITLRETSFPQVTPQYDSCVIREALHNAIAHQDYGLHGRIVVVERQDRIEIGNVGDFIPHDVEMVIRENAPQYESRNDFLSTAMANLGMVDSEGGGIKRMFEIQRQRLFPLPDYDLSKPNVVKVTLHGRIIDERYSRLLMEKEDLKLGQLFLIDQLQKGKDIGPKGHQLLEEFGFPIGRYPNISPMSVAAQAMPDQSTFIRYSDFSVEHYLEVIVDFVASKGPVSLEQIDQYMRDVLPSVWTNEDKKSEVRDFVQRLQQSNRIETQVIEGSSMWISRLDRQGADGTDQFRW